LSLQTRFWPRSFALDARLEKETGLDEADQLGDERRLRSMSFFEAIAGNDEDTFCKMLNEGMDPNVELPTPVPIALVPATYDPETKPDGSFNR
jgi:hypothetical protein